MHTSFTIPEAGVEPVPGYCLSQRLGRGGYGEVWRAYAPGGFQVALKFVPRANACGAVELRALDVIRDIRHPNLLVTFASWEVNDWLIIAMELADKTLMDRYRELTDQNLPGIPRDELLDYFQEAARGIDFLNEPRRIPGGVQRLAIQHRDIKPQNILLVGNGVKVADFGLARLMNQVENGHSGGMTPAYAAPEFFKGQTTSSSDQYSFAVTYCKMRGGRLPFEGGLPEVMAGHLSEAPDLRMLPNAEQAIVARALAKDPRDRWPSCRAFVDALLACDNVPQGKNLGLVSTLPDARSPAAQDSSAVTEMPAADLPAKSPGVAVSPVSESMDSEPAPIEKAFEPRMVIQRPWAISEKKPGTWIIGRDSTCNLIIQQSAVSGQHCRLTKTAQGYVLEDLGSSNGTYVNGHKIAAAVHVLPSDQVTLGQSVTMPWPPDDANASAGPQTITIGRDSDNDIVLDYAMVSGRHARITYQGGRAEIEDLGSTNGVALGTPSAKIRRAPLTSSDVVYFGSLPVPASELLQGLSKPARESGPVIFRGQPMILGRDASCDQVLDFPMISGQHARLWQDGARILIEDLGSSNGTFVNGERARPRAEVKASDIIGLGSFQFKLEVSR